LFAVSFWFAVAKMPPKMSGKAAKKSWQDAKEYFQE
jgi:hypothetical protein